jgi:hypothetical protein
MPLTVAVEIACAAGVSAAAPASICWRSKLYARGVDQLIDWDWLDRRDRNNRQAARDAFIALAIRAFELRVSPPR